MTMKRMQSSGTLSLLFCVLHLIPSVTSQFDESSEEFLPFSLRGQQNHRRLKKPNHPCILVKVEVEYDETAGAERALRPRNLHEKKKKGDEVLCELIDDDIESADGHYFVPIVGIEDESLEGIESGVSTFMAEGAVFHDGALQIPQGASIEMGSIDHYTDDDYVDDDYIDESDDNFNMHWRSRRLRPVRKKKILVVRADAYDESTSADMAQLSNDIFGTSGDKVTLKSQYRKCSHGKVMIEAYDQESGVIEVQLNGNVNGMDKFAVQDAMLSAATEVLGNLPDVADHVMLCLPKGTGDWIAYAYVKHWLSVFNDEWCQQLSTQVHEIGHNLGLSHSGKGGDDYSDQSGMMGYSFKQDDGPLQCFNPAKSYMLRWYKKGIVEWDPLKKGTWFGNIVGVTDFDGAETVVVVKIIRKKNGKDLYIGYNRQKQFNKGVKEEGDNVTVVEQKEGYEVSNFIVGLRPGSAASKRTFNNFENTGKNLVIDFMSYGDIDSIDKAFVAIHFDDCKFPDCCSGDMCHKISELLPTKKPTQTPTKAPIASRETDPTAVLYEILPNPVESQGQYFEIFNPHSRSINLKNYRICIKSGRNAEQTCMRLTNFRLGPGEYYMLCRNKLSIPESRTCHQEEFFRVRKARRFFVSLTRVVGNKSKSVDEIEIPPPRGYPGEARTRNNSRMRALCDDDCWTWSTPTE